MHAKAAVADSALHFQCFGVDPAFQLPRFHVCILQLSPEESCTGRPPQIRFRIFRLPRSASALRLPSSRPVYFDCDGVTLHLSAAADPILYPSAVMERLASSAAADSIFATLAALPLSLWHLCHPCHLTSMPPLPPSPPCHFASSAAVEPILYLSAAAERVRLL